MGEQLDWLDAIGLRTAAATPGFWEVKELDYSPGWVVDGLREPHIGAWFESKADAEFVAHARKDVPALLAWVAVLEAAQARVRALIDPRSEMASLPYGAGGGRFFGELDIRNAMDEGS